MPPNPDRVWLLAQAVKTAVVAGYVTASVDLPAHQFVSPGLPAWDCGDGLLAVQVESTFGWSGLISSETNEPNLAAAGHAMRGVTFAIHLIRCVPTVDENEGDVSFPTADEEEDAAEPILRDSQLLLNVLVAAQRAGDLPGCNSIVFQQWQSTGPSGGMAGGVLRIRIGLE